MDDFDSKRASEVFLECSDLLSGKSDREIAIIGVAYIEDILTNMLEARIVPGSIDLKREDSFSFKVNLARAVGLLRKTAYDSLKNIKSDNLEEYIELRSLAYDSVCSDSKNAAGIFRN